MDGLPSSPEQTLLNTAQPTGAEIARRAEALSLCQSLKNNLSQSEVIIKPLRRGYFSGERIERELFDPSGAALGVEEFEIHASPGSGFAGQVYRASALGGRLPAQAAGFVALKVLVPRSAWKERLRDLLFRLSFQTDFAPRRSLTALQSGLAWQMILRLAAGFELGDEEAVARPFGYYWEAEMGAYVEVDEWVESRPPRYPVDQQLIRRWLWGGPPMAGSEMAQKRQFMDRLSHLCTEIGAGGLSRQYAWYTGVSQPNVLVREKPGEGTSAGIPEAKVHFTAVDCRVGLAVPFFFPVTPVHARLIWEGLKRGVLAHYAEADLAQLQAYLSARPALARQAQPWAALAAEKETCFRAGLPDLWQRGLSFFFNPLIRPPIILACCDQWLKAGLISEQAAASLGWPSSGQNPIPRGTGARFNTYLMLANAGGPGRLLLRLWANAHYRDHVWQALWRTGYRRQVLQAARSADLLRWQEENRVGLAHAQGLAAARLPAYVLEKACLSWMPAGLHRWVIDPQILKQSLRRRFVEPALLFTNRAFREQWVAEVIALQTRRGILNPAQAEVLAAQARSPHMQGFLRDFGFTAGLEVFSKAIYLALAAYGFRVGNFWPLALAALGPVPPSGVLRAIYTLAQLFHDLPEVVRRNDRRLLAARLIGFLTAPWRWVGNLFSLVEMFSYYNDMSLMLADYWVSGLVSRVPIFGGRGTLLEYTMFNLVYNLPLSVRKLIVKSSI